jgi:hypothetical protein
MNNERRGDWYCLVLPIEIGVFYPGRVYCFTSAVRCLLIRGLLRQYDGARMTSSSLESLTCHVFSCIFDQEAMIPDSQRSRFASTAISTHLYHQYVGRTVPRCHKLCASIMPPIGGKSSNSKLIAKTIQATINPGHAAQIFCILRYRAILNQLQRIF